MVAIERPAVTTQEELHTRERYYIEEFKAGLNKQLPTRTHEEYRVDHRGEHTKYMKQYMKHYRSDNGVMILCECGISYTRDRKASHLHSTKHQKLLANPFMNIDL
jgi:hypothetical protein